MKYENTLWLTEEEIEMLGSVNSRYDNEDTQPMGEDDSMSWDIKFANGIKMVIRLCGVKFEKGTDNAPYTECILEDADGKQLVMSESNEFGVEDLWELYDNDGNVYAVRIQQKLEPMTNDEFMDYVYENFNVTGLTLMHNILDFLKERHVFTSVDDAIDSLEDILSGVGFEKEELIALVSEEGWGLV